WDHGTYDNLTADKGRPQTVTEGIASGRVEFVLHGNRLRGRFALVRMQGRGRGNKDNWLLIKRKDEYARPEPEHDGAKPAAGPDARTPARRKAQTSGKTAEFTHTDKLLFPEAGIRKGDVLEYYRRVAGRLLPYLRDRPVTLERLPEGLGESKPHFWQKDT